MAILVRPATPEDEPALRRASDTAFATVRAVYRPNPAARANLSAIAPNLQHLVAEANGQIVATAKFGTFDDCLRIIGLGVIPTFRRQGVARAIVEALARIAAGRGCRVLALYTIIQTGNVPIFNRLGFHVVSEQPDEYSISPAGQPLMEAYMERSVG